MRRQELFDLKRAVLGGGVRVEAMGEGHILQGRRDFRKQFPRDGAGRERVQGLERRKAPEGGVEGNVGEGHVGLADGERGQLWHVGQHCG